MRACRPCISVTLAASCVQEAAPPGVAERYRRSSAIGTPGKQAYGVRMGAGANSYVVRDKQIEVLKNVHGGVRVSYFTSVVHTCSLGLWCLPAQLPCMVQCKQMQGSPDLSREVSG